MSEVLSGNVATQWVLIAFCAGYTILLPLAFIGFAKLIGYVDSIRMRRRRERVFVLVVTGVCTFSFAHILGNWHAPMIMRIFMTDGAYIGIVGTIIGVLLGVVFCLNIERVRHFLEALSGRDLFSAEIYFLSRLPAQIDWCEVCIVAVVALILSFLATVYPAYRAAKYDPVEALRYE